MKLKLNRAHAMLFVAKLFRFVEQRGHAKADKREAQARAVRQVAYDASFAKLDAFEDYKLARRNQLEDDACNAADEKQDCLDQADHLRAQAESIEITAAARYTSALQVIDKQINALVKETI